MEVSLYNSTICRLCGEENDSGSLLYSKEENKEDLCELINTYLPIKVSDDGQLPRTICPGCTIQLEATVEFLNLIINGQKIISQLQQRENEFKKNVFGNPSKEIEVATETIIYEKTGDKIYPDNHAIALQMGELVKPKRKRGRPPKKNKPVEEVTLVMTKQKEKAMKTDADEDNNGKRRRKTPTRFKEVIQGKELDRIFKEEGVTDGEESESEGKQEAKQEDGPPSPREPEVIGHLETSGELVLVTRGKGRGRPKGRLRQTKQTCAICGVEFTCAGRYMSHVAAHGRVAFQCACARTFPTRLLLNQHHADAAHHGFVVLPAQTSEAEKSDQTPDDPLASTSFASNDAGTQELPDLNPVKIEGEQLASDVKTEAGAPTDDAPAASPGLNGGHEETVIEEEVCKDVTSKGKPKLKCNHCDKMFSSKQSKSLHTKAVHLGEKPYACGECGARFAYPRSLALHSLAHRRRQPPARGYACDLCGKVLNHPSSVVYHKEAEHAGQRYVCNTCGKSFKHKQLLQRHQLVHSQLRPFTCKTCNSSFKTKANLLNHTLLHTGVKKFSCEICKHKFAHKTSLTLHMRWHTGQKPFSCGKCGKSFSQKGNLSEHERIHTGEKPYECGVCSRRFTTSSQRRLHARRHQPHEPYACDHCPKRFQSRSSWAAHVRRAAGAGAGGGAGGGAGARRHACGVCARAFAERWALRKHMRRHTGERPHRCPHCPKAFADASNLNKHKKQVHKQISLLVKDQVVDGGNAASIVPGTVAPAATMPAGILAPGMLTPGMLTPGMLNPGMIAPGTLIPAAADSDDDDNVIYVAYDVGDDTPAYHILDPEQTAGLELPGGGPGGVFCAGPGPPPAPDHLPVTDEEGNPLHFTMEDGTQLAITLADGKSLQIVTQDGQAIPVEINRYTEEVEEEVDAPQIVQQFNVLKTDEASDVTPVTHYYTIV